MIKSKRAKPKPYNKQKSKPEAYNIGKQLDPRLKTNRNPSRLGAAQSTRRRTPPFFLRYQRQRHDDLTATVDSRVESGTKPFNQTFDNLKSTKLINFNQTDGSTNYPHILKVYNRIIISDIHAATDSDREAKTR